MSVYTPVKRKESIFEKAYAQLNPEQKQAVDSIEGPVMVVAGPGTGKTQVVSMRVANILRKTQMRPSNILCLTFSNSGVKAMRERMRSIIGADAYGVTVSTVHSFCNDIIVRHPELFIDFRALEQVSGIERLRIVRRGLKKLGPASILGRPMGDKDRAGDVLKRIDDMKRDGITPKQLQELILVFKEDIKTTDTSRERDLSTQAYKNDLRKVEQFKEFITLYQIYNANLRESHRYDFNDMVLVVLSALGEHEWLLAGLQERYQYLLLDEFQDLNGAQNRVIERLLSYVHTDQAPNVFVVGDDDQAIFRFQGANIGNMKSFLELFSGATIIPLVRNYRSTQAILDTASAVIEYNKERLVHVVKGIEKHLIAEVGGAGEKPVFLRYPDTATEYSGIAGMLKNAHKDGIAWSDMAVICRRNEEVFNIAETLSAVDIPTDIVAKRDLITHPQVLEVIALLRAVETLNNCHVLSGALGAESLNCPSADLARVYMERRERKCSLLEVLLDKEELQKKYPTMKEEVFSSTELLLDLHSALTTKTLPEIVQELLVRSHVLFSTDQKEADPRVIAGIHAFYDYVKNRCYEQKSLTLKGLLADIDQYLTEPSLKLEYDFPHLVHDGVQLMTAHGAKGLEFAIVVMADARYGNWGNRGGGSSLSLPEHLIYEYDKDVEKQASQEDERRLFYVAMTRAKQKLILAFAETYRSGEKMRDAQVSSFIAETGDTLREMSVSSEELPRPIETIIQPPVQIDTAFRVFLEQRLENFELSVTALNAFLDDPQLFLWEQLLMRPRAKAAHLAFGTAVHAAFEDQNLAWKVGKEFSTENLINSFETYLQKKEVMTEEDRSRYLHLGSDVLRRYADKNKPPVQILSAEKQLRAHLTDNEMDIPLKGKVDRIDLFEPNGRNCRVIDYKTGSPKKTEDAVRKDERLFRQLLFYKILCDGSPSFIHKATLFTFDFVGKNEEDRRVIDIEISEQETEDLKKLIQQVWKKITALDFTPL